MKAKDHQATREERRRLERFELQTPTRIEVQIEAGHKDFFSLITRDISSRGAYVNTAQPLPEGLLVKLELLLSPEMLRKMVGEMGKAKIRVRGRVIRSDSEGMAIEFESRYKILAFSGASF
jgi:hypothetical protein